ncbi:hypothetical protein LPW26_17470 [Rhodopseudomonas sp. HC1]|uniref:hypothetical protein n=1 Tax=Rhodopseudomonas infernalis TaxID=2897386 RepID=UPI001EE7FAD6|nr:hypothetical protein [Rhodopseudomonas infernalis]MCG6206441.1 hypothetical protein [Rhodopseudomonas infernalis]
MIESSILPAKVYYDQVVRPTVEEFFRNKSNRRLAMLASMSLLHVIDHIIQNEFPADKGKEAEGQIKRYVEDLAAHFVPFAVVRAFALASKHAVLRRKFQPGFTVLRATNRSPCFVGRAVVGRTFLGDTVGGITVQWTDHGYVNLTNALKATMKRLESDFPQLKDSDTKSAETV